MFSGLVEAKTQILSIESEPGGVRLVLKRPLLFQDCALGDSIAVQGCCLTIVAASERSLEFQAGKETLSKTTLGRLTAGDWVNVERSLAVGDRLGGHLATGHVAGQGNLLSRSDEAQWSTMVFGAAEGLMRQMASKGSITVDGVSLTLVDVDDHSFSVALIPHTLQHTTLGALCVEDAVNLETDLLAKYVQRQLALPGVASV